ncbi:LacI family DNA-binding transcriptional regulator [Paenibacillus oceani]|uniref:LacI family DNA-binding transcriptional regulator n=1 Tax=Paenibacillus oceani TaxID=2772510 RepID=A0A927C894_9BACL|nr:LacI family DNA-binding transcriptional regulator [Paenibacillus oceani]MBD2862674.1 LacI family DNA-binding transcriptional regulator [Paenibacillus oceani]
MSTIKDVAREAGVSISTVSFAINGTAPVAPETKKRIFETIERLNYQPNSAARGLVTRKSNNIGIFVPHPDSSIFTFSGNQLFANLLQGIGEVAGEKGYNLLLAWDRPDKEKPSKVIELARSGSVDGLLFLIPNHDHTIIDQLIEIKFPFVFMGNHYSDKPVDSVDIDNFQASYECASHLLKLGHKRIAFISPGPLDFLVSEDRYEGYSSALKDAYIEPDERLFYVGDDSKASGYRAMEHFFASGESPSAIVAGRDVQAVGILKYAKERGMDIPRDIAVVSFENSQLAEMYDITSYSTDLYVIGNNAAKMLFKLISRKKERQPQNVVIPSELFVRGSCGSVSRNDPLS